VTSIEVATRDLDGVYVGTVRGEIDLSNANTVRDRLLATITNKALGLVIDLSAVEYVDSAGINLLFDLDQRLRLRQQRLALVVPAAALVREILRISQVLSAIPAGESMAETVADVRGSDGEVTRTNPPSTS
jgi:anti-sigma B factor antagonist